MTAELLRREGIPVLGESRMGELLTEGEACLVKITRDPAKNCEILKKWSGPIDSLCISC